MQALVVVASEENSAKSDLSLKLIKNASASFREKIKKGTGLDVLLIKLSRR
jgi:hypothetical protein